jgi:hypothetical protein
VTVVVAAGPWNSKNEPGRLTFPPGQVDPAFAVPSRGPAGVQAPEVQAPSERPASVNDSKTARRNADSVKSYMTAKRQTLKDAAKTRPSKVEMAALTSRRAMPRDAFLDLATRHSVALTYVEWVVPGATDHGGCSLADLNDVLARFPNAQLVYGIGTGTDENLALVASESDIWLVALSTPTDPRPANLYGDATSFGLIDQ